MKFGNIFVGKRLFVGCGKPEALGKGETEIRGSAYVEGPLQVGDDQAYDKVKATVMIGAEYNSDSETHPDKVLMTKGGDTYFLGNHDQVGNLDCSGTITGESVEDNGGNVLSAKKDFDIPHPTKEGHRLRHVCLEGPEAAVYVRGRVCNGKNIIDLPDYWDGLVDYETLTVQLTALHSHQNVIVKRISPIERRIYLQSQGGMPVDCFYHIMAERKDGERLIPEYEGKSIEDYPGDNREYTHNK